MATAGSATPKVLDFDALRTEGIRQIQRLAGRRWTDHNTHDPGLTLLEALCYALTDLAYRAGYSLPDLLGPEALSRLQSQYGPEQMLPGAALSEQDLRKYLLDVAGVLDARIFPDTAPDPELYYHPADGVIGLSPEEGAAEIIPAGLYTVSVYPQSLTDQIKAALNANRPLCTDWKLQVASSDAITITADIELASDTASPERVADQVIGALRAAISPRPLFQNRREILRRERPSDDVYEGPLLQQGCLDDGELERLNRGDFLRASDLIQIIMDVPGVQAVRSLWMSRGNQKERWLLPLAPGKYPELDGNSTITLYRGLLMAAFQAEKSPGLADNPPTSGELPALAVPTRPKRKVGDYFPMRFHLPALYGLQSETPPENAQVKQLSAYLLLFEQLLADGFAQLDHASGLFDMTNEVYHTVAVQSLQQIPGASDLYTWKPTIAEPVFTDYLQTLAEPEQVNRLQRLLDHLLARFAEDFSDYTLLQFNDSKQIAKSKRAFLRDYPTLGKSRGIGCDYRKANTRSGLEHRIARLLGLPWPPETAQIKDGEAFFMVEHILLRPIADEKADEKEKAGDEAKLLLVNVSKPDPYSRQLTYVFPNYSKENNAPLPDRFESYRHYVQSTLFRETPAHLVFNCLWLDKKEMENFADAYSIWRMALEKEDNHALRVARDRVVDLLREPVPDQQPQFLIGWTLPILDLKIGVPLVPPGVRMLMTIYNSQAGVEYTLCYRSGKAVKLNSNGQIADNDIGDSITGTSITGGDLPLLLPPITEDATFLIKAAKKFPGLPDAEGFLLQKVRVRVKIATDFEIQPEEVDFGATAKVKLQPTQAEVDYVLLHADQDIEISDTQKGKQGEAIELTTLEGLKEDTAFRIRASRILAEVIIPKSKIHVRPDPGLEVSVQPLIVDFGASPAVKVGLTQQSAQYELFGLTIRDEEFIHTDIPDTDWSAQTLATALTTFTLPSDWNKPEGGVKQTGNQSDLTFETGPLEEDRRFFVFAEKPEHNRGVILNHTVAVLVKPNPGVSVNLLTPQVNAGEMVRIQLEHPQPGVLYSLHLKDNLQPLVSTYFHNTETHNPDGVDFSRVEFDFWVGPEFEAPLVLETTLLTESAELEIVAEKVQTGLKVKLNATLSVSIIAPSGSKSAKSPPKPRTPRKKKGK